VATCRINGSGINNTISISKTIKIIARRKNRSENGMRAVWFGSKPHSKGESFSRSAIDRADSKIVAINTTIGTRIDKILAMSIWNID